MDARMEVAVRFGLRCLKMPLDCLKDKQLTAIVAVMEGRHVFVTLPTGFGKSVIFQILPFAIEYYVKCDTGPPKSVDDIVSVVIVISPLLSLMEEQCKLLKEKGIRAAYIGTGSDATPDVVTNFNILYFSPECLLGSSLWRNLLLSPFANRIIAFAIDEVHCVVKWYVNLLITQFITIF